MPLVVNLRHLEAQNIRLEGELPVAELDIETRDEIIQVTKPLRHDLEVQKLEDGLLAHGRLHLELECQCVRCLKRFQHQLELNNWTCHVPLQGEDHVAVVNDSVDLTPYVREDILLEFPSHPVCQPECRGLPSASIGGTTSTGRSGAPGADASAWAELNKLKF